MSSPPRNSAFAIGKLTGTGIFLIYTVPAAHIVLVKSLNFQNSASTAGSINFMTSDPVAAVAVYLPSVALPASGSGQQQQWFALNANAQLYLGINVQPVTYWVSGAILPYTPGTGATLEQLPVEQIRFGDLVLEPQPLPPGTRGEPTPILLPPPASIVSPA